MSGDSSTLAGLADTRDRKRARDQFRIEAARRWLRLNPGEPVSVCVKATGIGESKARALAREVGHAVDRTPMGVWRKR